MQRRQFGPLRARVTGGSDGNGGGDGPLVVLLHGYGAPGDDLVALAHYLRVGREVRFLFPEAPLALGEGARAWWLLDLERLSRRARGERVDRSGEQPESLDQVRDQLAELLAHAETELKAPPERTLLGGFSQGSMLALDVALHARTKPRGLVLLSSTLIAQRRWEPLMASCRGLPVLQTHGTGDPLLPFDDAVRLRDLLQANGAAVEFVEFAGGHELPPLALARLGQFVTAQLG